MHRGRKNQSTNVSRRRNRYKAVTERGARKTYDNEKIKDMALRDLGLDHVRPKYHSR